MQYLKQVSTRPGFEMGFILFCLLAGSLMRLVWVGDMKFKADEIEMY